MGDMAEECPVEFFDFKKNLPKVVLERINAVKNVTEEIIDAEQKFHDELHELEVKYNSIYRPLHNKIRSIVSGEYQPNAEEKVWKPDEEMASKEKTDDAEEDMVDALYLTKKDAAKWRTIDDKAAGIPYFWLHVMKNTTILAESIQENDEPVLEKLVNIDLELCAKPKGFNLHFQFAENDYFTDKCLTKHYVIDNKGDLDSPLHYEGPEIKSCVGCKINWKDGMDLTKKSETGSFFNFFSPPVAEGDEKDIEMEIRFAYDFDCANMIRESVIPRAILYFTGDSEDDEFDEEGELMEGDE